MIVWGKGYVVMFPDQATWDGFSLKGVPRRSTASKYSTNL
jgi:hypothetical protein